MKTSRHPTNLRRMIDARVHQLVPKCPPLAASLGKQAGGGSHVTLKQAGKTQTVYVPKDLTEEVQTCIQEHRRLKTLLREITQLQFALIRLHRKDRLRRGNSPWTS